MSYSKRQIIQDALGELGMSGYAFDLDSDQVEQALHRLDAMLAEWNGRGIRLGYPLPSEPENSSLESDSGIPDWAWTAAITTLAIQLAPSYGKTVSVQTLTTARSALNTLFARSVRIREMRLDELPAGAGNKGDPFIPTPDDTQIKRPEPSADFQ